MVPVALEFKVGIGNSPVELGRPVLGNPETDDCPVTEAEDPVLEDEFRTLDGTELV